MNLVQRIAAIIRRSEEGGAPGAEAKASEIIEMLNTVAWTPDEKDRGARAAVEKLRIEQRDAAQKQYLARQPISIEGRELIGSAAPVIMPPYVPLTDQEWRKFRNLPICAAMLTNIEIIFKVVPRVGPAALLGEQKSKELMS